jgi:two-component SAPR family response regulator
MPDLSGPEAKEVSGIHSHAKLVFMSGYAEQNSGSRWFVVIEKPITPEALMTTLDDVLHTGHASEP